MDKIRVSAVSYTNTLPFLYGLQHSAVIKDIELSLDVPSQCAYKLIHQQADLGIVPVGALRDIPKFEIVSEYCLGTTGAVDSVFIFSDKPIIAIDTLRLDPQSRTSNLLAQVLLRDYWKKDVQIVYEGMADAYVEIGDRTFGKQYAHPFVYDLPLYWNKLTGLPFAFAVWAANKHLPESFVDLFNSALADGLDHREELIAGLPNRSDFDFRKYLMENIDYHYDDAKKEAVSTFLTLSKSIHYNSVS